MATVSKSARPVNPPAKKRTCKPPARFLRLLVPPSAEVPGVLRLTVDKEVSIYRITEIECETGGRGFRLEKLDEATQEPVETYHVRVHGETRSCECKGFCRWNKCKHGDAVLKLVTLDSI
jgi:hypothetical protein